MRFDLLPTSPRLKMLVCGVIGWIEEPAIIVGSAGKSHVKGAISASMKVSEVSDPIYFFFICFFKKNIISL